MKYFYADANNQPQGPYELDYLQQLAAQGIIKPETYVVEEGGSAWKAYRDISLSFAPPSSQPPPALQQVYNSQTVPTYLVQSILVTLFCCLPFGIVSIVYAAQVSSKLAGGDYEGAMKSSKNAKLWSWLGFGFGLLMIVAYFFVGFFGALAEH